MTCPDYETWCAYVDGCEDPLQEAALRAHLTACDRCFATVTRVRRGVISRGSAADEVAEPAGEHLEHAEAAYEGGTTPWRRVAMAAAALLAVAGLWQLTSGFGGKRGRIADGTDRIGFAAPIDSPLRGPVRVLVIAVGDTTSQTRAPDWGSTLFSKEGLAAGCGPIVTSLSVTGTVWPRRYCTRLPAHAYAESGRLVEEVLQAIDRDVDFRGFDANADGVVDYLVLVIDAGTHERRGLGVDYVSGDRSAAGTVHISGAAEHGALVIDRGSPAAAICEHLSWAGGLDR